MIFNYEVFSEGESNWWTHPDETNCFTFFHPNVEVGKDSLAAPSPSSSVAPA